MAIISIIIAIFRQITLKRVTLPQEPIYHRIFHHYFSYFSSECFPTSTPPSSQLPRILSKQNNEKSVPRCPSYIGLARSL
jgi:hypothetical protein